jgi:hypothetical protein
MKKIFFQVRVINSTIRSIREINVKGIPRRYINRKVQIKIVTDF